MDSETDTRKEADEYELFLQKLSSFKEEYFKLKSLCVELVEENKTLQNRVQLLENKLKFYQENNLIDTIISKQQTIIEFRKNEEDYKELRIERDTLKGKVEILENKIKTDKSSYELEIKNLSQRNTFQTDEIRKLKEDNDTNKEKLDQVQKQCDELSRKNEELNAALESMDVESGEVIARLDMEHKDQLFRLNSENQLLLKKLKNQEELYIQKIQNLESDSKNKGDFIKKLMQDKNEMKMRSAYQPLDQAFRQNKIICKRKLASDSKPDDRTFSPCVTGDEID